MIKTILSPLFLCLKVAGFSGINKSDSTPVCDQKMQIENATEHSIHDTSLITMATRFELLRKQRGKYKAANEISHALKSIVITAFFCVITSFGGFAQINPSDACTGVPALTVNTNCITNSYTLSGGFTATGLVSATCATPGSNLTDGWYSFVATSSTVKVTETANRNRAVSIWTSCGGGTQKGCAYAASGSTLNLTVTTLSPGVTYFLQIHRRSGTSSNSQTGTICLFSPNDTPCTAKSLTVNSSCITTAGQTNGLTNSGVTAPSCAGYFGQDAWYKVVVPAMGYLIFETSNLSTASTAMAIYSGTCGSVTEIACNVNTASTGISNYNYIGAALTPGDTIFIRLWKTSNSGGLNMTFDLCVHTPNCSSNTTNDFCEGAATLTQNASANFGSNTNLYTNDNPGDVEVPFSCGTIQNNSWYSFTATSANHNFNFSAAFGQGCSNGIQARVFSFDFVNGCCTNPISKSNCVSNANTNAFIINATGLTIGETYYLMIDGWNNDQCSFSISGWSAIGVLPIKLIEFTGEAESRTNLLKWRTASEINSDVMVVQKSEDGINFTAIGSVKGAGNSTTENKYAFEDFDIHQTVAYYRLKQIDFDGTFEYSNTISVIREGKMGLFPNPTKGDITLKFADPIAVDWTISFTDLYGRNVTNSIEKRQASQDQMVFATDELKKGYYFVKVMNGNGEQIFNSSFIKE
ncbi:MAG: T9SS type A sorting domain-containing protein [Crocinitomicaceae bacterium]